MSDGLAVAHDGEIMILEKPLLSPYLLQCDAAMHLGADYYEMSEASIAISYLSGRQRYNICRISISSS